MTRAIIITGARAIVDSDAAIQWARETVLAELAGPPGCLLAGAAIGVDRIAALAALESGWSVVEYHANGRRTVNTQPDGSWLAAGQRPDPLLRDRVMVDRGVQAMARGMDVRMVALFAPWCQRYQSGRGGTRYTADHGERHGLTVVRHLCPREFWPAAAMEGGR